MKDYGISRAPALGRVWTTISRAELIYTINEACAEAISDTVRRERRRAVKIVRNHICSEDWCWTCTVNPGAIIANILGTRRKSK